MNKRYLLSAAVYMIMAALYACSGGTDNVTGSQLQMDLKGSRQGQAVGFADFDGDGIEDKLVGAPYASVSSQNGAVLVYKGTADGYGSTPMTVMTGDDNFGFSIVNLGDVDGDHKDDFAVGALSGSGSAAADTSLSGTVSIYKGGSSGQLIRRLAGDGPMDKFGMSLAGCDLNNNGVNDIIVGAPFNTPSPSLYQQGAVYVYFGPDFTKRVALYASKSNPGLGWMVACGDINGDGISDLLISASGKALGFYGSSGFSPDINSPDVTISSSASGFGKAIAVIGDLNGDGKNELAVGAPNAVINGNRDTGSVYVIKGGTGTRNINLNTGPPADLIVKIDGNALFNRFGFSILAAGDVDGDARPDFVVGAPMADVVQNDLSGRAFLFKGKDIGPSTTLSNATAFNGMVKDQAYGTSLAICKKGQILIGGPRSNAGTGGVSVVDALTGIPVPGGSSGGTDGSSGECH
jgi:hypothetical protein